MRQDIEALRIVSAFAIVWFHSSPILRDAAFSGLINFLILSIYISKHTSNSRLTQIRTRSIRLLLPWLVWFTIYAIINIVGGKPILRHGTNIIAGVLAGPSIHLWYLPYIFVASIGTDIARKYLRIRSLTILSALAFIVSIPIIATIYKPEHVPYPWAQYLHATPALLLGIFFGGFNTLPKRTALSLAMASLGTSLFFISAQGIGLPYSLGICVGYLLATEKLANLPPNPVSNLGKYAFGIFLIHMIPLLVFRKFALLDGVAAAITAFFISLLVVATLHKILPKASKALC